MAPARDAFESWSQPLLELADFRALPGAIGRLIGAAQAHYLLGFSLLAPSTHNTVPQAYKLDLDRQRIELWLRRQHVLPASDPTGREALASLGCAVENLVQAAVQYGIACEWEMNAELRWSDVAASATAPEVYVGRLQLSPAEAPDQSSRQRVLRRMLERRTVRAEFDNSERLPDDLRSALLAGTPPYVRALLFETDADKFAWGKLDELATKHKLEEGAFRRELGHWLLPNEDDQSPRGMRGREFGFDDVVTRELSARLRGEAPMPVDQLAFMARAGRSGMCSASAVCVLSCLDASPAAAILAGCTFQRQALLSAAHGFVCAVHTAVCHVAHARAISQATLLKSHTPSLIFRIGKPRLGSACRAHSARPCLQDLLLETDNE